MEEKKVFGLGKSMNKNVEAHVKLAQENTSHAAIFTSISAPSVMKSMGATLNPPLNLGEFKLVGMKLKALKVAANVKNVEYEFARISDHVYANKTLGVKFDNGIPNAPLSGTTTIKHLVEDQADRVLALCTQGKTGEGIFVQGACPPVLKVDNDAVSNIYVEAVDREMDKSAIVSAMRTDEGFAQALVTASPPIAKNTINKLGGISLAMPKKFGVSDKTSIDDAKTYIERFNKNRLPSGPYLKYNNCAPYGLRIPDEALKATKVLTDHPVPEKIKEIHLFDSDVNLAIAFTNLYPDKDVYLLGTVSVPFNKKLRIGVFDTEDMLERAAKLKKENKGDGLLRVSITFSIPSQPLKDDKRTIWDLGLLKERGPNVVDGYYDNVSRYTSVFSVNGSEKYRYSMSYMDYRIVLRKGLDKDTYGHDDILKFMCSSLAHHYNYIWLRQPLCQFYDLPPLPSKVSLRRSVESDDAMKDIFNCTENVKYTVKESGFESCDDAVANKLVKKKKVEKVEAKASPKPESEAFSLDSISEAWGD